MTRLVSFARTEPNCEVAPLTFNCALLREPINHSLSKRGPGYTPPISPAEEELASLQNENKNKLINVVNIFLIFCFLFHRSVLTTK